MQFQILNSDNQPLTMEQLDKEVAEFWGVKYNDDEYARPFDNAPIGTDWFNFVGYAIIRIKQNRIEWSDVIGELCKIAAIAESSFDGVLDSILTYKPYIELCLYWKSKGYVPVSL